MVKFEKHTLSNGLRVLVHTDDSTEIAAVNLIYDVGARDESPSKTGFAHLFEHLMFGGSLNVASFDTPLQNSGGHNNAFTNNDCTNYYITLPVQNLETAFWLESDRMLSLAFTPESLEVQRKVVIEEFKQRYLNQPYGDVWLNLRPLAYKSHPYQWATIGKDISHIEEASLSDVKSFFFNHYLPSKAVLVVAGKVKPEEVFALAEKWFGPIPIGSPAPRELPKETLPFERETLELQRDVPQSAHYFAWSMPGRLSHEYPAIDLITDVLARGQSSRLFASMVKREQILTSVSSYVLGSIDPGLLIVSGMLTENTSFETSRKAILSAVEILCEEPIPREELEKVKNNHLATHIMEQTSVLNKAMNLAYYELLGDANFLNSIPEIYASISSDDILNAAQSIFGKKNYKELQYQATPS